MTPAERDSLHEAMGDLGRVQSLTALLRWATSHRDPPEGDAWGGLYLVACDAETEIAAVAKALSESVGTLSPA